MKKQCPKCSQEKDSSNFYKDKTKGDGLSYMCKSCRKIYAHKYHIDNREAHLENNRKNYQENRVERMKQTARYIKTPKGKDVRKRAMKRYNSSSKGRANARKYNQSEKGKAYNRKKYKKHKSKYQATGAVRRAILRGDLPIVSTLPCYLADKECSDKMEYHHYLGYEKKHRLDVQALCQFHHHKTHGFNVVPQKIQSD